LSVASLYIPGRYGQGQGQGSGLGSGLGSGSGVRVRCNMPVRFAP